MDHNYSVNTVKPARFAPRWQPFELESQEQFDKLAASIASAELAEHLERCFQLCRRQGFDLTVLCLALDAPASQTDPAQRLAVTQTLESISLARAARLYTLDSGDYLATFCGEPLYQARRIGEDYRQSIVDLNLKTGSRPMTISVGMCSGPADSNVGAERLNECAMAQLRIAQDRGGNRVEARQK